MRYLAAALLLGLTGPLWAADLPAVRPVVVAPAPLMTWTGCYAGAFVGLDIADTSVRRDTIRTTAPVITGGAVDSPATLLATSTSRRSSGTGVDVGGRIGCNQQIDRLVVGLQTEGGYLGVRSVASDPIRPTTTLTTNGGGYGALVGRIGYAFEPFPLLVYARGGAALTSFRFRDNDFALFLAGTQANNIRPALLVGAGVEYRLTQNVSLTLDYSFLKSTCGRTNNLFFTPVVVPLTAGTATVTGTNIEQTRSCVDKHMVSVGLNYYFGSAAPVPVVARY